jgi:hypothetical protein
VSTDALLAGDPKLNIVVRPKDVIVVSEPQRRPIRIIIGRDEITRGGKATTWEELRKELQAAPAIERRHTYLEIAAGSADLPVKRFFEAKSEAAKLVKELGLAHVSEVGVEPGAAENSIRPEYYIGGLVKRSGVYALTARDISLKQAILASGGPDDGAKFIVIVRKSGDKEQFIRDIPLQDLLDGKHPDMLVHPQDQIMVRDRPTTGPAEAPAPR